MTTRQTGLHWSLGAMAVILLVIFLLPLTVGANEPPPLDRQQADDESNSDRPREPMAGPKRGPGDRLRNMDPEQRRELRRRFMERRENMPPGDEGPMRIGPEIIDWALEAMKAKLPGLHARLTNLRQENPQRFEQAFRKLMPVLKEYRDLSEHRPDLAETVLQELQAEERLHELSRKYLTSKEDSGKQAAVVQEMDQLVRKQFELRQRRFEARLEEFEERIKDQQLQLQMMKDRLHTMTTRRDDFVNRRVSQVKAGRMGEPVPGMGFEGPNPELGGPRPGGGPNGGGPRPGRRPPPPGEDRPRPGDRHPPPPDDGGGSPPDSDDFDS